MTQDSLRTLPQSGERSGQVDSCFSRFVFFWSYPVESLKSVEHLAMSAILAYRVCTGPGLEGVDLIISLGHTVN